MQPVSLFFPHERLREGQDELVRDIETALKNGKILLAQAPTGLGKTAGVLSVAVPYALQEKKRVFFLTNRHTQHHIAITTLQQMQEKTGKYFATVDLIGKRWMCNQEIAGVFGQDFNEFCKAITEKGECQYYTNVRPTKGMSVEAKAAVKELQHQGALHTEEVISFCKEKTMCSYEISLELAKEATVIIGDYNYLFNPHVQSALFSKMNASMENVIVIVDEGHNLPSRITDMMSSALTNMTLRYAVMEAKKFQYGGVVIWLQEIMRILTELAQFTAGENKERKVRKEEFVQQVRKVVDYEELINQLELAAEEVRKRQRRSFLGGISSFLESWMGEEEGFVRYVSERSGKMGSIISLHYACLDPSMMTKDIFQQVHAGVIMSGTLQPTFMYKDVLGVERAVEKEYSSPFPIENKLALVIPETSTKYTVRGEEMYTRIAQKCSELAVLIPGNVALFFPSYELRDKIGGFINSSKKKFWEKSEMNKEEKEVFLEAFKAEKERGGVLLGVAGANFAEGIDLPGDLLNGVVVVGLPLSKPDLKTKELIAYYDKKYGKGWEYGYIYPAMSKCIQSAGRCIRSETDKGAVIFLDERFTWQNYFCCLPREGLRVTKDYAPMIQEFFGKNS